MLSRLSEWFDARTGYRRFRDAMLLEHIPGGARWRYVWGSTLAFVFTLQLVTGVLLMTAYSPGSTTAWSSVYFIQYEMDFGWLIRGLHHFGSQTMVVLLGLHMLQVVIAGAELPPREINWWLGMGLLGTVLGLSLTGYLLPWDQKGFWATQVATNIAGNLPVLGPFIQKVVVGGPSYGHATLTRFYALHVGILPPLTIVLIVLHLVAFRRHGVTAPRDAEGQGMFWPEQAFKDLVVSLVIFGLMLVLVLNGHGHKVEPVPPSEGAAEAAEPDLYQRWAKAGREGLGANLDAPADPSRPYPARPEWYFLFLFQLLKYFEGEKEIIGTVIIPQGVAFVLFLLPLLGYGRMRPLGHIIGVVVMVALLTAVGALTMLAVADDTADPLHRVLLMRLGLWVLPAAGGFFLLLLGLMALMPRGGARAVVWWLGAVVLAVVLGGVGFLVYAAETGTVPPQVAELVEKEMKPEEQKVPEGVKKFHQALDEAEREGERAVNLAAQGVPEGGAVWLLRSDPLTQFKGVFLKHCASCHSYGEFGSLDKAAPFRIREQEGFKDAKFAASDLDGFGKQEWIYKLLLDPGSDQFFGRSVLAEGDKKGQPRFTRMAGWVRGQRSKYQKKGKEAELEADFKEIAAWLATAPSKAPAGNAAHARAYKLFSEKYDCTSCHAFGADAEAEPGVPTLTGYGSANWLRAFLRNPAHPRFYGDNNAMPAFRDWEGLGGDLEKQEYADLLKKKVEEVRTSQLSNRDREILIRYFTGDYHVIFGGQPIAQQEKR